MTDEPTLAISFPELGPTEAGADAALLTDTINQVLREAGLQATASQKRLREDAQDLGTIVSIALGGRAAVAFLRGVADAIQKYMARTNRSRVRVQRPDGQVVIITNLDSKDVAKVLAALQ